MIDEGWLATRLAEATASGTRDNPATRRLRLLLQGWAEMFADGRPDVQSSRLTDPRRGLHSDEAASFLRAVDSGVAVVDDAGFVTLPTVRQKTPQGRYALLSKSGDGVSVNLEYLIQIGVAAELILDFGWPTEAVDFERGEFDALCHGEDGRVVLAVEAKARATGPDSLEKLVRSWINFAGKDGEPARDNAGRKFAELARLCQSGPVATWLVADGARWTLLATPAGNTINLDPSPTGVSSAELGGVH